ncbi:FAD-dependent oxidoreductase [Chromobacterium subtsugae]|uniref:FAD-dependent oxidoreductase n=1 Tax=Chromobacterium subtsugae TaxID=251747 RepID=UPI000640F06A|nr:FAD-dependent oxidoreductase [Chromobacterium subtsugae]OBU86024.1 FAD-dependent oxidoreductase [Chromobacterium subtsugae]
MSDYDLIIIGGGLIGLSTAYNAVSPYGGHPVLQGNKVLVLEQSTFFNQFCSSAGASRQFRFQYSETYMTQLVMAAVPEWELPQSQTVTQPIPCVGSLWFGDPNTPTTEGGIAPAIETMQAMGVPFQSLTRAEVEEWYGFRDLPANYSGFFQRDGGVINLPATLRAMYNLAHDQGVQLKEEQKVIDIESSGGQITVTTDAGAYRGKKLVITAGAFTNEVIAPLGIQLNLTIWNMVSAYFRKTRADIDYPTWFAFQQPTAANANLYYGFPETSWSHPGYIRVAPDYPYQIISDPRERRPPTPQDYAGTCEWVAQHMSGLSPEPEYASACMVALADDGKEFILDTLPGHPNIVLYTAGWAAKLVPLLGKICVQLAINGATDYDISPFSIGRPGLVR